MNPLLFLIFMVPATFLLGFYDVFTKRLLSEKLPPSLLMGVVYTSSGVLLLLISLAVGIPEIKPEFWPTIAITAPLGAISIFLWYKGFQSEDASLIAPLRMLTPPLVLLTGLLVLKEAPSLVGMCGVVVTMVGLWLLFDTEKRKDKVDLIAVLRRRGVLYGLTGALLFAISFPYDKKAIVASSSLFFSGIEYFIVGGTHFLYNLIKDPQQFHAVYQKRRLVVPLVLVHMTGGFLAFHALNFAFAAYAASAKRLWSLWAVILSGTFLKEQHIGRKVIATVIMLLGIVISLILG